MDTVRFGVIGCGSMAGHHMGYIDSIDRAKLTAICDNDEKALKAASEKHPDAKTFADGFEVIKSGEVDAILICTPHYSHPPLSMAAFEAGVHVLTEKPVAVTAKAAQEVNEAHAKYPNVKYGAMFQQRTAPHWQCVKRIIDSGSLGKLIRTNWTITTWFRTQTYYNSGGWRATWKGEGGGVLINQCPHNLDLFQWFVGMPSKVTAKVGLGKYHNIEVEDEVMALLEYDNGAIGHFVTSTAEAPGVNRLEIVGENGTLIFDDGKIILKQLPVNSIEYLKTSPERFKAPSPDVHEIKAGGSGGEHKLITENFVKSILDGDALIATGEEGIHGLELGNAMLMSGITNQTVNVPTDREAFDKLLIELGEKSTFKKETVNAGKADMGSSFQ